VCALIGALATFEIMDSRLRTAPTNKEKPIYERNYMRIHIIVWIQRRGKKDDTLQVSKVRWVVTTVQV
jgi:hypothetical protein